MEFCLNNEKLCVRVSSLGAELRSVRGADGTEYLWQGDERFWRGRATNIFPYVGRLTEDSYLWRGARYKMGRHGFARGSEFTAEAATDTRLVLSLRAGEATRESYPLYTSFPAIPCARPTASRTAARAICPSAWAGIRASTCPWPPG